MNQDPLELLQSTKSIRLTESERSALRSRVIRYMNEHPVEEVFRSWTFGRMASALHKPLAAGLAAVVFFVAVTGWAAAKSLPGDALYPLKVNVGEEVVGLLAMTPQARAEWETKRVTERLKEAEKLVVNGNLDEAKRNVIEQNLKKHTEEAQKQLAHMQQKEDYDTEAVAASKLETSLKAHSQVLQEVVKASSTPRTSTLLETIKDASAKASTTRVEAEGKASSDPKNDTQGSAEGKMKAAASKIKEARKSMDSKDSSQAKAALDQAQSMYDSGKAKYENGSYNESFILFQQALHAAQEASAVAKVQKDMKTQAEKAEKNRGRDVKGISTSTDSTVSPTATPQDKGDKVLDPQPTDQPLQERDRRGSQGRGQDRGNRD